MSITYSTITVPISEQDCHDIINDGEFNWTFPTNEEDDQHQVHVHIILEGGENDHDCCVEEENADAL